MEQKLSFGNEPVDTETSIIHLFTIIIIFFLIFINS